MPRVDADSLALATMSYRELMRAKNSVSFQAFLSDVIGYVFDLEDGARIRAGNTLEMGDIISRTRHLLDNIKPDSSGWLSWFSSGIPIEFKVFMLDFVEMLYLNITCLGLIASLARAAHLGNVLVEVLNPILSDLEQLQLEFSRLYQRCFSSTVEGAENMLSALVGNALEVRGFEFGHFSDFALIGYMESFFPAQLEEEEVELAGGVESDAEAEAEAEPEDHAQRTTFGMGCAAAAA